MIVGCNGHNIESGGEQLAGVLVKPGLRPSHMRLIELVRIEVADSDEINIGMLVKGNRVLITDTEADHASAQPAHAAASSSAR